MTFKELKNQIKEQQKRTAQEIRNLKLKRKEYDGYVHGLDSKKWEYRHRHIAYCQFFNKTPYERIEPFTNQYLNESTIDRYIKEWTEELMTLDMEDFEIEDVRDCA